MAWMTVEATVAVTAGIAASSVALVGFGLDSVIELCAAVIVVWQLRGSGEERETRAVKLIGVTFFALAAYLAVEGIRDLALQARLEQSTAGLAVTAAALVVMPLLALAQHRTGRALATAPSLPTRPKVSSVRSPPARRCSASALTPVWAGGGPALPPRS